MKKSVAFAFGVALTLVLGAGSLTFAQKADLSSQWATAKAAAAKYDIETGSIPANSIGFAADTVDSDTFRELKKSFESDGGIKAVILVEKGSTWVFQRYNRYWWPAMWGGIIAVPLVAVGALNDVPAAIVTGAVLGGIGAGVGFYTMEKSEVANIKNDSKGPAAVFILKK
ncbi:MAG: hypothetical protein LCH54_10445 [Bacteroidetes bacterium]|nr:hypothetical protein [Bacteroidota bacterium]